MHILFLTDNFPPESNAPATRTFEHAREWIKQGHQVTVITCTPNFPDGKVFAGYRNKWFQKETTAGIEVRRVKTYISPNEGFSKRTLDFASFMCTGFLAGLFVKKPDVIVGTSPQFFTAVGTWALSAIRFKPFVFELRDIWPATITEVGAMKKNVAIRALEKLEVFLYHRADTIISVTHSFKKELMDRGINGDKIEVVLNGVDLSTYKPALEKDRTFISDYQLDGKFIAGYIGTLGLCQGLKTVIHAAALLQDQNDIQFVFAGGGAEKSELEQLCLQESLNNVTFIPRQAKENVPALWSLCDISIICLKDAPIFKTVIPSKIFESMGMGLPMLASAPNGEATEILLQTGAGDHTTPDSPAELATKILELFNNQEKLHDMATKSRNAAKTYNRKTLAENMLNILLKYAPN